MTRVQESASRRGLGRIPLNTWDTMAYSQQAGGTHPTGMHSCCYRLQRSCGQGNIFAPVCHSVHGGVFTSVHAGIPHPPEQTPPRADTPLGADIPLGGDTPREQTPPRSRHPHRVDTPWEQTPPQRADIPPEQTPQEQTPPWEQTPPRVDTPQEQTPPSRSRHPEQPPPPRSRLWHTVNERPVRILLECILVVHFFRQECNTFIDFN